MESNDIKLIHGDCLEKMKDIPDGSIDMILCEGTTNFWQVNDMIVMGRI
jgi:hypothetical protein